MARRPKKPIPRKNHGALTPEQEEILLTGTTMEELCDMDFDAFAGQDPEKFYWQYRDFLLSKCQAGTRPHAFFKYECKVKRLLVSGDPRFKHSMIRGSYNGVMICSDGKTRTSKDLPKYETDFDILTRLKLLNYGEPERYEEARRLEAERKRKIIQLPIENDDTEDFDE